ncbi:hypothetical protein FOA43_001041 [Brettanomyces nanus]|uniref:Uncharacterized protein n=1 Tax=Eeniella nana TaxID=13502 RepID=A0A875RYE6_EENNA|nr:uncharacterized protein FOA43_001041 [Brettanomyces nanus]QPG73728.1 hypothetical protein FOA43_001041 [Brettanomyces nanus]
MNRSITHKKEPSSVGLKSRISSISSETVKSTKPQRKGDELESFHGRRRALKEFYKLQKEQLKQMETKVGAAEEANKSSMKEEEQQNEEDNRKLVLTVDNFDEYVKKVDFIRLLKEEDEILEELGNNQSEIKSIIYNNYYELIKINEILMNMKRNDDEDGGNEIKSVETNLNNVKKSLGTLKEVDLGALEETKRDKIDRKVVEDMCKGINRMILGRGGKEIVDGIDGVLPELSGESLILQMNEVKERRADKKMSR